MISTLGRGSRRAELKNYTIKILGHPANLLYLILCPHRPPDPLQDLNCVIFNKPGLRCTPPPAHGPRPPPPPEACPSPCRYNTDTVLMPRSSNLALNLLRNLCLCPFPLVYSVLFFSFLLQASSERRFQSTLRNNSYDYMDSK